MPLEHAILAFLQYTPMTGYTLKKYFDVSINHFWTATQSHIYKSLDGLLARGWVEVITVAQEDRPNRKVYHITAAGSQELHDWLSTPLEVVPQRSDWLIQVFFASQLNNDEIAKLFTARIAAIRAIIQGFDQAQADLNTNVSKTGAARDPALWQMTLDYGKEMRLAELCWLEGALEKVRTLPALPESED
jgi:PadR family transcriptional regulator, regulatory protein AphA